MAGVLKSSLMGGGLGPSPWGRGKASGGFEQEWPEELCPAWGCGRLDGSKDMLEVSGQGGELSPSQVSGPWSVCAGGGGVPLAFSHVHWGPLVGV